MDDFDSAPLGSALDEAPPLEPAAGPAPSPEPPPPQQGPPQPARKVRKQPAGPEHGAMAPLQPGAPGPPEARRVPQPGGPAEHEHMHAAAQPIHDVYGPPPMPPPPGRMPMPSPTFSQAVGQSQEGGQPGSMLGLTLATVAGGAAIGGKLGGWAGAAAGVLFGGGAVNAIRAVRGYAQGTEAGDREGRVSAMYAALGAGAGGFVAYRYARSEQPALSPNQHVGQRCDIRPVGP